LGGGVPGGVRGTGVVVAAAADAGGPGEVDVADPVRVDVVGAFGGLHVHEAGAGATGGDPVGDRGLVVLVTGDVDAGDGATAAAAEGAGGVFGGRGGQCGGGEAGGGGE
jgi:hypothetical protein